MAQAELLARAEAGDATAGASAQVGTLTLGLRRRLEVAADAERRLLEMVRERGAARGELELAHKSLDRLRADLERAKLECLESPVLIAGGTQEPTQQWQDELFTA